MSRVSGFVRSCTSHTTESHTSVRDWTKLRFNGESIEKFRTVLAGYKSTIQITIGGIHLLVFSAAQQAIDMITDLVTDERCVSPKHVWMSIET